jgi:hypothetical protein
MSQVKSPSGARGTSVRTGQVKRIRSRLTSLYPPKNPPVNPPVPHRAPNLSRTRPPADAHDLRLWPAFTNAPYEDLDLDSFDGNGNLLPGRSPLKGGC